MITLSDEESSTENNKYRSKNKSKKSKSPCLCHVLFCEKHVMHSDDEKEEEDANAMLFTTKNSNNKPIPLLPVPPVPLRHRRLPPRLNRAHPYQAQPQARAQAQAHAQHVPGPILMAQRHQQYYEHRQNYDSPGAGPSSNTNKDYVTLNLFDPNPPNRNAARLAPRGPIGWPRQQPNPIRSQPKQQQQQQQPDLNLKLWF